MNANHMKTRALAHDWLIGLLALAAGVLLVALSAAYEATAAGRRAGHETGTFYGSAVPLGSGTASTYVTVEDGVPMELGVAFSEPALTGLPGDHDGHDVPGRIVMPDGHVTYERTLSMPTQNPTPFRHVLLNWNPSGHEPPGMFERPHFDVHFYLITPEERQRITPEDPAFAEKAARYPAPEFVPAGYFSPEPMAVPGMGVHWLHEQAPELSGAEFVKIFIYGSWDGRLIFAEPMITKAFLETKPDFSAPLPSAALYSPEGWYPGAYRVRFDPETREYRIALAEFEQKS